MCYYPCLSLLRVLSITFLLQGNIRVFCRVRPLVDGGLSKHIQLLASDNKTITLAKTEEVRIASTFQICQRHVCSSGTTSRYNPGFPHCIYGLTRQLKCLFFLSVSHRQNCRHSEELQLQFWPCFQPPSFTEGGKPCTHGSQFPISESSSFNEWIPTLCLFIFF